MRRPEVTAGGRGIEGNGVTVDGDTDLVQQILGLLTVELGVDQVNKDAGARRCRP